MKNQDDLLHMLGDPRVLHIPEAVTHSSKSKAINRRSNTPITSRRRLVRRSGPTLRGQKRPSSAKPRIPSREHRHKRNAGNKPHTYLRTMQNNYEEIGDIPAHVLAKMDLRYISAIAILLQMIIISDIQIIDLVIV